ncbi:hypothetical protein QYE76_050501 [Lolium multiflorum]|uniref:CCHC-type domain-containing protein n=1 Tax=Lolium multiflorum TaxID=4521 RepID=A0AAD8SRR0_LOLMU|nr:hypothetical protein QYE76_050501 [Lolium multiflorum]
MVNKTTKFKKQGKPKKDLKKGGKKAAAHPEKPKGGPKPDTDCYYCNGKGHWKRNCSKYLADLKSGLVKKKKVWVRVYIEWCCGKLVQLQAVHGGEVFNRIGIHSGFGGFIGSDCLDHLKEANDGQDGGDGICYEEPDLSGGVEGVDYLIVYGTEEVPEGEQA